MFAFVLKIHLRIKVSFTLSISAWVNRIQKKMIYSENSKKKKSAFNNLFFHNKHLLFEFKTQHNNSH